MKFKIVPDPCVGNSAIGQLYVAAVERLGFSYGYNSQDEEYYITGEKSKELEVETLADLLEIAARFPFICIEAYPTFSILLECNE